MPAASATTWRAATAMTNGDETPTLRRRTSPERLAVLIEVGSSLRPSSKPTRCTRRTAPDAMRHLEAGQARGELVITVIDPDDATAEETS
jgi:hypothetical protein